VWGSRYYPNQDKRTPVSREDLVKFGSQMGLNTQVFREPVLGWMVRPMCWKNQHLSRTSREDPPHKKFVGVHR